jgi:hypothetical protein
VVVPSTEVLAAPFAQAAKTVAAPAVLTTQTATEVVVAPAAEVLAAPPAQGLLTPAGEELAASGAQCLLALAGEGLEDGHDDLSVAAQSLAVQGVANGDALLSNAVSLARSLLPTAPPPVV